MGGPSTHQSASTPPALYHWRSHGGAEVDLLLERDGRLYPIEIKLASQPGRGATSGISALRRTCPDLEIAPGLVVCPARDAQRLNDCDLAWPWDAT